MFIVIIYHCIRSLSSRCAPINWLLITSDDNLMYLLQFSLQLWHVLWSTLIFLVILFTKTWLKIQSHISYGYSYEQQNCLLAHMRMQVIWAHCEDFIDFMDDCRIDSLSVLPTSFGSQDASKILSHCNSVQSALKVTFFPWQ